MIRITSGQSEMPAAHCFLSSTSILNKTIICSGGVMNIKVRYPKKEIVQRLMELVNNISKVLLYNLHLLKRLLHTINKNILKKNARMEICAKFL